MRERETEDEENGGVYIDRNAMAGESCPIVLLS